jgi:hypothetical protein
MPTKRSTMSRRKSTLSRRKSISQRGKGLRDIANFIRNNQLISKGLSLIPHPAAQAASSVAGLVGLGRKKRRVQPVVVSKKPRRRTKTVRRVVVPVIKTVRRVVAPVTMRGRGIFSDIGGGLGSAFGGLGGGLGSLAHGLFGSGKRMKKGSRVLVF